MLRPLASVLRTGDPHATIDRLFISRHVKDLQVIAAATIVGFLVVFLTEFVIAVHSIDLAFADPKRAHGHHLWLYLLTTFLQAFSSLTPVLAVCGAVLTWAYQTGSTRLGVVDLFACEISTLCKVTTIVGAVRRYVDRFNQPPPMADGAGESHMPNHQFTSQESYFPVFESCTKDLQTLEARVVVKITEFYTFMKAVRDSLRALAEIESHRAQSKSPNEAQADWARQEAVRNVVYMMFLGLESARHSIDELVEFEPEKAERTIMVLLSELEAYCFLIRQFRDPEDMRHQRLMLRDSDYLDLVQPLCKSVEDGKPGPIIDADTDRLWEPARKLLPELQRRNQEFLQTRDMAGHGE